jgi:hypothetical protein
LPIDFPDDATMRISHEAIYIEGRAMPGGGGVAVLACVPGVSPVVWALGELLGDVQSPGEASGRMMMATDRSMPA